MNDVAAGDAGDGGSAGWPAFSMLALRGRVLATAPFVRALLGVDACDRVLFNAAVDPRVPFAEGVAHGLAAAEARRAGRPEPPRPQGGERFLPVPRPEALYAELTALRAARPWLGSHGLGSQRKAIAQACAARRRHVEDCVAARAAGRPLPRVPRRRARDGATVTTRDARIERPAAGPPLPRARVRLGPNTEANRARKGLGERRHVCPDCELDLPRDVASALVTLGNALREYRGGPDPGGRIAAAGKAPLEALARAEKVRERRRKGGRTRHKDSVGVPAAVIEGVCALGAGQPPRGTSGEGRAGSKLRPFQPESPPRASCPRVPGRGPPRRCAPCTCRA